MWWGSDVSQKMLDVAGGNVREAGVDFPLIRSDFRELRKNVTTVFDAAICMGNSIPHLMTDKDILQALESIRECIKNKGFIIFEFRNYDHLLSTRTKFLPMRINARKDDLIISILYVLDYLDNLIRFNVVYLTEDTRTGKTEMDVQIVDYNPILAANFRRLLENAGFREIGITETGPNLRFVAFK
jgi:SAM-dependent methyltransferase